MKTTRGSARFTRWCCRTRTTITSAACGQTARIRERARCPRLAPPTRSRTSPPSRRQRTPAGHPFERHRCGVDRSAGRRARADRLGRRRSRLRHRVHQRARCVPDRRRCCTTTLRSCCRSATSRAHSMVRAAAWIATREILRRRRRRDHAVVPQAGRLSDSSRSQPCNFRLVHQGGHASDSTSPFLRLTSVDAPSAVVHGRQDFARAPLPCAWWPCS